MDTVDKKWMFIGAVAIAAVSSLLFTAGIMNPLVPMPLHMVILAWTLSYGLIVVMPLIYMIEFKSLCSRNAFGKIILAAALSFAILSILYFWGSWEYGIKYQGEAHTRIVAVENIVGFLALVILAYFGMRNNSKLLQYSANLLLFLLLSWCAFPYLGEMP
jgi:hypothetical protein